MADGKGIRPDALIAKFQKALHDHWGYIWGTAGVRWTEERQKELEKTTDSDRANGRKYGSKWIGHVVADCSGLFKWAFKQLGGEMYHGSNTMYLKWCTDKGTLKGGKRTDGRTLKPGTAVFVWNGSNYSHVGLYIGDGKVIEAKSTVYGVVESRVTENKWSHWGELKGVDYSAGSSSDGVPAASGSANEDSPALTKPTLKRGDKGQYVTLLQTKLIQRGYDLGKWGADGDFGNQTEKAVREFQHNNGLTEDGIVGAATWAALDRQDKWYTVTIKHLPKSKAEELIRQYSDAVMKEEGA